MLDQAKVIQKMVQEIGLKNVMIEEPDDTPIEELPPPPELPVKELTPEEVEAKSIYDTVAAILNKTRPDKKHAYQLLLEAAKKGNVEAKGLVAWAKLFGNPLEQDLDTAKEIFQELAEIGNPDGHTGLGFLYASGLTVNVSQAKALVHYTFGAFGGNTWAQMVLGYRYWSGITVAPSCEKALDFYRQVADKGKNS